MIDDDLFAVDAEIFDDVEGAFFWSSMLEGADESVATNEDRLAWMIALEHWPVLVTTCEELLDDAEQSI